MKRKKKDKEQKTQQTLIIKELKWLQSLRQKWTLRLILSSKGQYIKKPQQIKQTPNKASQSTWTTTTKTTELKEKQCNDYSQKGTSPWVGNFNIYLLIYLYVCVYKCRGQKVALGPWNWHCPRLCATHMGCWELNVSTEPSLQPPVPLPKRKKGP